jgi:hypothetical protein
VASTHSLSSDGIKIDTKGFMDKVMNNNESLKTKEISLKPLLILTVMTEKNPP